MGEFFYRNGVDFTAPGFLRIATAPGLPADEPTAPGGQVSAARPLVMFSGGKDSLALTYALKDGPVDFFLYNPTESRRSSPGRWPTAGGSWKFTGRCCLSCWQ